MKRVLGIFMLAFMFCEVSAYAETKNQTGLDHKTLPEHSLIIIRHGEGDHNVNGYYNSNPFHPNYRVANLTETGIRQVKTTAQKLAELGLNKKDVAAVYVSPLPRTLQTAEVLKSHGLIDSSKIIIDPRLIEIQMGNREGKFHKEFPESPFDHLNADTKYQGETYENVQKRVQELYAEILGKHKEGHVVFVSHGTPSQLLVDMILKEHSTMLPTAGFKVIELKG